MFGAEELRELHNNEKAEDIEPDWEVDTLLKAAAREGKRESIITDLIIKLLGLDVSLVLAFMRSCWNLVLQIQLLNVSRSGRVVFAIQASEVMPVTVQISVLLVLQTAAPTGCHHLIIPNLLLQVCADTLIGSDQVRGVSGGQRKRVTTGNVQSVHTHNFPHMYLMLAKSAAPRCPQGHQAMLQACSPFNSFACWRECCLSCSLTESSPRGIWLTYLDVHDVVMPSLCHATLPNAFRLAADYSTVYALKCCLQQKRLLAALSLHAGL